MNSEMFQIDCDYNFSVGKCRKGQFCFLSDSCSIKVKIIAILFESKLKTGLCVYISLSAYIIVLVILGGRCIHTLESGIDVPPTPGN